MRFSDKIRAKIHESPRLKKAIKQAMAKVADRNLPLPRRHVYEFDLQGYTIIRNFIPQDQVDVINQLLDERQQGRYPRKFPFAELDPMLLEMAAHPDWLPAIHYWLGAGARLDHMQGNQSPPFEVSPYADMDPDDSELKKSFNIHIETHSGFEYLWNHRTGRAKPGLLAMGISLSRAEEGDGGLVFVPGSHNMNMTKITPKECQDMKFEPGSDMVWVQPVLEPGDLIIFTEGVIHGTLPWLAKGRPRRILYYRYVEGHMCWRKYEEMEKYAAMATTDTLRDLLRPPYVAGYTEDEYQVVNPKNDFRSPNRW